MKYTHFHEHRFHQQVDNALISVHRILDTTRNPRLAHEDPDHRYEDKYALASLLTNTALVSHMTVLERLGVTSEHLATVGNWVHHDEQAVTLRFEAIQTCKFLQEKEVPFVQGSSVITQESERSGRLFGKSHGKKELKTKLTTMVKEYHWRVRVNYKLVIFAGASPDAKTITLQSRDSSTILYIKGTEKAPFVKAFTHNPIDVNMTWFFQQIAPQKKICQFVIDRSNPQKCKTPRRNEQVDQAVDCFRDLCGFADRLRYFWTERIEKQILGRHAPAVPNPDDKTHTLKSINSELLYNPILPLLERNSKREEAPTDPNAPLVALSTIDDEESPLLSMADMDKFLGEQIRTMDQAIQPIRKQFPPADDETTLISTQEAELVLMCCHLEQLGRQYEDSVDYMEDMLKKQLVAAIGKQVQAEDFYQYMTFHYQNKLYGEAFAPHPFCFAIRRPNFYPDGILSIEKCGDDEGQQPVETFTRKIATAESTPPIRVPLNAATTVELTGDRYLHGWMQYRFTHSFSASYRLGARARQFSCFLVMVGTMAGADRFEPKDAIVLQNKDEVLIPLLLNELPTAKEFKDAISSMSPEQQRFAKSFREMQLESSVFGVCVVQLKPQLEDLLGLPPGGLTKEMQLTQDLLSLFIDYQIPSDLLSYDGPAEEESRAKKIALVKEYTKSVLDVIQGEKDKRLKEEKARADMAIEKEIQRMPQLSDMVAAMEGGLVEPCDEAQSCVELESFVADAAVNATGVSDPYEALQYRGRRPFARALKKAAPRGTAVAASSPSDGPGIPGGPPDGPGGPGGPMSLPPYHGPEEPNAGWSRGPPGDQLPAQPGGPFDGPGPPVGGAALKTQPPAMPQQQKPEKATFAPRVERDGVVDFTQIPKQLDAQFEQHDSDSSLRATIIKTGQGWTRLRQDNLLAKPERKHMSEEDIRSEKHKAFDLLDALSRSGSLPLRYSELHVIVAVTHAFENDVIGTVVQDNVNPIEKVEKSSLLMASTIHGLAPQVLLQTQGHVERLKGSFPALFD